ncbi:MAG: hypothetical protein A2758_01465 [Candidatus Zambryskibacteria bacterium RIFCSPHIGHO2_01_FULL_49_18]|uniref:Uncharacterized protein n=2 Tax=Candidatus Zambryskiibacteriota TaxID=1817925 RepID=A0A1G2T2A0_9BACT|nr:MAG: hypothetical protein A2758_01465 [Candidatus Zambryskibacteria bacterium RIFCSPHIGHO2_01_FULL_49_18]OHB05166.1 MAG: hypothetical protein A3A26_02600 [Candidatus Zambryskibacteria bacterium RIFCSPLOWO2_01_FULL_47_14]
MSSYSEGQIHQLADQMESAGLTPKHVTRLGQSFDTMLNIRRVLDGEATFQFNQAVEPETPKKIIMPIALKPVTSDGVSGKDGIKDLEKARYNVGDWVKDVMKQKVYVVTNGKVYKPVVLKGEDFTDDERVTSNIRKVAEEMKLVTPPAQLARLLRKSVSDEELEQMGLYALIVMHQPITGSGGFPNVLGLYRNDEGRWLNAYFGHAGHRWYRDLGFVFLAPQE